MRISNNNNQLLNAWKNELMNMIEDLIDIMNELKHCLRKGTMIDEEGIFR